MPAKPGCSFEYIWGLVQKNNGIIAPTAFTPELMIAIFWEESLFNNTAQVGSGTAVGYGQVEPAEFYRFNAKNLQSPSAAMRGMAEEAQRKGYLVHNLPPVSKAGGQTMLNGALSDEQAVQVAMALVRDMHERKRSRNGILQGYAGVGFQGDQPARLQGNGRQEIINGWLRCEAKLLSCSKSDADVVMVALREAKSFNQWDEFRSILFPNAPASNNPSAMASMPVSAVAAMKSPIAAAQAAQNAYRNVAADKPSAPGQQWAAGRNLPQQGNNSYWGKC